MKKTKKALLSSMVALFMSITMLIGSTFAWFTDNATSSGNIIKAGNLDLKMSWTDDLSKNVWYDVEDPEHNTIFNYDNWEPGYTEVRYIKIENAGKLAFNYNLAITPVGEVGKLAEVINVFCGSSKEGIEVKSMEDLSKLSAIGLLNNVMDGKRTANGTLLAKDQNSPLHNSGDEIITIAMNMITTASNEYQGKSIGDGFKITGLATQCAYEEDSFGSSYDNAAEYPVLSGNNQTTTVINPEGGKVPAGGVVLTGEGVSAEVPAGVELEEGVDKLTFSVTPLEESATNITTVNQEILIPVDVHISGVSKNNTTPIVVNLGAVMPKYLNMGNYTLFHVEKGENVTMTYIGLEEEFTAHNQFKYDPVTGELTLAMATFSEVAILADEENGWEGKFDYTWYDASETELTISNADQLAAFGAIVGGMNGQTRDSFAGKTVKLISDINLGDDEEHNNTSTIFYPIGYYNSTGMYERPNGGSVTSSVNSFEGIFDGNGHTIRNFYQNTWEMVGDYNDGYSGTPNYYKDAMGLFGYVNGGTVKNLTIDHFSSDGEFTPTGVIAAYADGDATFENIAITNCNPRVYNTGNGGIIGVAGDTSAANDDHITLKNITVDNTNKISALWGSYDVACGGLVGMYRGNVDGKGNATGDTISFENCHVSAQMDVYNDVCGNYQYYAYRYAGMIIGSIRHNTKNADGKTIPDMTGVSATGCTVNYGTWNDYYYCEYVKNGHPSYSGKDDYKFSRVPNDEIDISSGKEKAKCIGHNHSEVEDNQAVYLPFHQLFTGYSWGVSSIGLKEYSGIVTDLGITEGDQEESVEKFESKFTGNFLYRVGNQNTVKVGSLFSAKDDVKISNSGVWVTVEKVDENAKVEGTFTKAGKDKSWTEGTIQFSGTGVVKVTIQDYDFCTPTVIELEVVDAVNAISATSATNNNVVLLDNISGGFTVSGRYAVYGNGFTCNYTSDGRYLNNGLKQGVITVSDNGILDNLRIKASIYPESYLYYEEVKKGPNEKEGDKTRYFYQLSAVAASGNATISNCYIYGGRNNVYVGEGDVTIKGSILECGTLANVQIQSSANYTVTFENVTTIQHQVNPTIGDTNKVMLGAGIIVGPETNDNPTIELNGKFQQYNWVNQKDYDSVTNDTAKTIISTALNTDTFNHIVAGEKSSNLGIIYLNSYDALVKNNTSLPYKLENVSMMGESGKVYSLSNAKSDQIFSDVESVDKSTVNGVYQPQFKYISDLGGQYVEKTDDGDTYCYREGDTIKVMFPSGDTKELNLASLVNIEKYSGQDLNLQITCKDSKGNTVALSDNKIMLSNAETYTVTYSVTDGTMYSWDVALEVSLKDTKIPNAYFEFDSSKQVIYRSGNSSIVQFIPFLSGMKIYDYNGQDTYLRFDGDKDFNKIAKASINNINTTGEAQGYHIVTVELTDGGKLVVDMDVRANSGSSTHSGSLKVRDNVLYVVNGGTTSGKGQTWKIYSYKFIGNNGTEINSGLVTFGTSGVDCSTATKPSSNFGTTVKYTVTYNANEGNCGQSVGYATSASAAVTLPKPTRSGYIFAGWYTAVTGGTRVGGAGESYTPSANVTLFAQWGKPCTVTYNANGGSCDTTAETYQGDALILPVATNGSKVLKGWYTAATGGTRVGSAGDAYNPSGEITLYAQWQAPATVIYDANGGTCGTTSATFEGDVLILPTPTRTGYTFKGWYTAASGGTKIGDAKATYIPSENITLYAQWERIAYKITVKTNNATVSDVTNGQTAYYGETISVKVSFSQNNSKTLTVTDASGNTVLSKSAAGTYTFTMPASDVTISASSELCVTPDTLVTLADGTQKEIQYVTYEDKLLVWDFLKGEYTEMPSSIVMNHGYDNYRVLTLKFEDGTTVNTINGHGFYDAAEKRFVILNEENVEDYIGHKFVKQAGKNKTTTKLASYNVAEEYTESWSILTVEHYNCVLEGMLTLTPAEVDGSPLYLMPYEINDNMQYVRGKRLLDIMKYGLYTYKDFKEYMTYEQFNALGLKNFKVSVGKGYITWDEILKLISIHIK